MGKRLIVGLVVVAALGVGGYVAADHYANTKVEEQAQRFAREMRKVTREFRYGSVEASILGHSIVMRDVTVVTREGERIAARSVEVKDFDWRNGGSPRWADLVVKGADVPTAAIAGLVRGSGSRGGVMNLGGVVKVAARPVEDATRLLHRAGYRRTTSDFTIGYRYDEDTQEFELRDVKLDVADLGTLSLHLKLGNVPDLDVKRPDQLLSYGTRVTLVVASLSFRDRNLVSRLLRAYAAKHNVSEAEALSRVLADLRAEHDRARDPLEREALEALARFVERPGEIRATVDPGRPMPLLSLALGAMGLGSIKDSFGVTITAR